MADRLTTDYARSIGVEPERDRNTAQGIYLTTADMRHIRTVLNAHNKGDKMPNDIPALSWSREIVRYIGRLPGDPRP